MRVKARSKKSKRKPATHRKPESSRPALWRRRWVRLVALAVIVAFLTPPVQVLLARYVDPPFTLTMVGDAWTRSRAAGGPVWVRHSSPPIERLGDVPRMALTAEDDAFFYHSGIDMGGVCVAMERNEQAGGVVAGGSTITQQTAKNVFLWQKRSWIRKGLETVYTLWMELLLPKERILELYLGVAEFGPGIYGAEAGARHWFGRSADDLSRSEAARLVSVLPSPKTRTPDGPTASAKAARLIRRAAVLPGEPGFDDIGSRWRERSRRLCERD